MNSSNIGNRLKDAAEIVKGFGIFISIVIGALFILLGVLLENEWIINPTILGVGIGIGGVVSIWLFSHVLYGFGVLINTANDIRNYMIENTAVENK